MRKFIWLLPLCFLVFITCGDDDDDDNGDPNNLPMDDPGNEVAEIFVNTHNTYRQAVGVDDIQWSEELAASAQSWADEIAKDCDIRHSDSGFGENIWAGTTGFFGPKDVVDSWAEEIDNYDESANECVGGECLHYTQMVWGNSTEVGCGMVVCDGFDIWVCQYNPRGNIVGQRPY